MHFLGQAEAAAKGENVYRRGASIERAVADAEAMLSLCLASSHKGECGNLCGLRAAMVAECASDNGKPLRNVFFDA